MASWRFYWEELKTEKYDRTVSNEKTGVQINNRIL